MQPSERQNKVSFDCRGLGSTDEGSITLRNPFSSNSPLLQGRPSEHNLNRKRKKRDSDADSVECVPHTSTKPPTFASASSVYSDFQKLSFSKPVDELKEKANPFQFSDWKPVIKKSKFGSPQKNTLFNHSFTKTSPVKKEPTEPSTSGENHVEYLYSVKKEKLPSTSTLVSHDISRQYGTVKNQVKIEKKLHDCNKSLLSGLKGDSKHSCSQESNSDLYGLLGLDDLGDWQSDSDTDDLGKVDFFSKIPEHVLEEIFAMLPLTDLLMNVTLVCTRFRDVVRNPKYLVWKTRYHGLKAKRSKDVADVNGLAFSLGMDDIQNILPSLPKCLHKFRSCTHSQGQEMLKCLKPHCKFSWSVEFLRIQFPECFASDNEDPDPWSVIGAIIALSDRVSDVSRILRLLTKSSCSIQDVIEALYCLATYLFAATTTHKAFYGPHYYVFYALYLYENEWQAKVSNLKSAFSTQGQQNIMKYSSGESNIRLTHEQMRIVNHPLQDEQVVKVVAFAGTGKTSTLVQFSKLRMGFKFLLVVYNKAAQEKASQVFPGNVECRTMSSLAFTDGPGHRFKRKLTTKLRPLDIINYLNRTMKMDRNTYARHVLSAIEKFMASSDPCLTLAHVLSIQSGPDEEPVTDDIALCILRDAENIWSKMSNPYDLEVRALHDTYLKLYQLEKPEWKGYSCIMIDEAQDCSPAMLDIVLSQTCPKILVGDPNQQIYSFRGAINALESVKSTHTYYLTQSFRFGPEIAYVAHCTLVVLKNITHKTLVGGEQKGSVTGKHEGQLAIIARGNATLFNEAVRLLCKSTRHSHEPENVRAAFVGGLSSYNLGQLVDIFYLMRKGIPGNQCANEDVKDKFIARFNSFKGLHTYAKKARDQELQGKVNLVLKYGENIPKYVQTIMEKSTKDLKLANVVFTTAHKAKGLEFDTVCLADDFSLGVGNIPYPGSILKLMTKPLSADVDLAAEYNILYVALTRAKKCLLISESLRLVLQAAQENFEVPVLRESNEEFCGKCYEPLSENNTDRFVLYKKRLTMMNGVAHSSGFMCKECAHPVDLEDSDTGFFLEDKSRHALLKILGSKVHPATTFSFNNNFFHLLHVPILMNL